MKKDKKRKFKKRYLLLIQLAVVVLIVVLLLHKPARYNPPQPTADRGVSTYLTHDLLPAVFNGAQLDEPYEITVTESGLNDILTSLDWQGDSFSISAAAFLPGRVILMGTADVKAAHLVVTIVVEPSFEQGLLNLRLRKVKAGAIRITSLAKVIAKKIHSEKLAEAQLDTADTKAKIADSLLNDKPFEPTFEIDDRRVRVEDIKIEREKMTIHLAPISL